jgi:hypothetical protein
LIFKSLEALIVSGQRRIGSRIVLPGRPKIDKAFELRRLLFFEQTALRHSFAIQAIKKNENFG